MRVGAPESLAPGLLPLRKGALKKSPPLDNAAKTPFRETHTRKLISLLFVLFFEELGAKLFRALLLNFLLDKHTIAIQKNLEISEG